MRERLAIIGKILEWPTRRANIIGSGADSRIPPEGVSLLKACHYGKLRHDEPGDTLRS